MFTTKYDFDANPAGRNDAQLKSCVNSGTPFTTIFSHVKKLNTLWPGQRIHVIKHNLLFT